MHIFINTRFTKTPSNWVSILLQLSHNKFAENEKVFSPKTIIYFA